MSICASVETLLQEATGICRGRLYPVAKARVYIPLSSWPRFPATQLVSRRGVALAFVAIYEIPVSALPPPRCLFLAHKQILEIIITVLLLDATHPSPCRKVVITLAASVRLSVCLSRLFSNLNRARGVYSMWLTRQQHATPTRPAFISVRVLRGRTYIINMSLHYLVPGTVIIHSCQWTVFGAPCTGWFVEFRLHSAQWQHESNNCWYSRPWRSKVDNGFTLSSKTLTYR